jgi:hypothetical protein
MGSKAAVASPSSTSTDTVTRAVPRHEFPAKPDPVLLRAAEIVRERGFCQGPWRTDGPVCAAGAVGQAGGDLGLSRAMMEARLLEFARVLGGSAAGDVHEWNDAPGRTAAEVAEALERAAYGL